MTGKVIKHVPINERLDKLVLEEINTGDKVECTIEKVDESYLGTTVSIYTTVTKIVNNDFDHVYPEGTIGTF